MPESSRVQNHEYIPAQYYNTKSGSYVAYWVAHPVTRVMKRVRIKVNRVKNAGLRRKYARDLIKKINKKLANGWNPLLEQEAPRGFYKLIDVLHIYLDVKGRELRDNSMRSYQSFVATMEQWLISTGREDEYVINFKKQDAISFLNELYMTKSYKASTYNNYVNAYRICWNWLKEQQYTNVNPFDGLKKKKEEVKQRILIPHNYREALREYLVENDEAFLMVCLLIFHCLIRPNEITHLKPQNFNFSRQTVYIPPEASKNGRGEYVTIPDTVAAQMATYFAKLKVDSAHYIFSDRVWLAPGKDRLDPRNLTRRWSRLREKIAMPKEMQLYSLKDSGIVQMLEDGVSPNGVMQQARHSSLEITTAYLKHANTKINDQVRERSSGF